MFRNFRNLPVLLKKMPLQKELSINFTAVKPQDRGITFPVAEHN